MKPCRQFSGRGNLHRKPRSLIQPVDNLKPDFQADRDKSAVRIFMSSHTTLLLSYNLSYNFKLYNKKPLLSRGEDPLSHIFILEICFPQGKKGIRPGGAERIPHPDHGKEVDPGNDRKATEFRQRRVIQEREGRGRQRRPSGSFSIHRSSRRPSRGSWKNRTGF